MFIPGIVISAATFPGIVVHELAHQLFCRWMKVPVFEVCYLRGENPMGYVIHEKPQNNVQSFFISMGPFFINSLLGFILSFSAALQFKFNTANFLDYLMMYLGISIAMHAFPSTVDASSLWRSVVENPRTTWLTKIVIAPFIGFAYLGALGSFFWLDLAYGIGVCIGLPSLLIYLFA